MNKYIHCPRCGDSHYAERYSTTTLLYGEPIWRNGVPQNLDPNVSTMVCHCLTCGADFTYKNRPTFE